MTDPPPMSADDIEAALQSQDTERRRAAVREVRNLQSTDRRAHGFLMTAVADSDWRVRREAVEACLAVGPQSALLDDLVAAAAQGENVGLRNAAIESLSRLGPEAVTRLRTALRDSRGGARKFYIEALGETGSPEVVGDIVGLLNDSDPNVAAAAMDALARIGGEEAQRALRERLDSDNAFQRMAALDGLYRTGARLPWSALAPLLDDRLARRAAIPLLGRCGDAKALEPLVGLLEGGVSRVASPTVVALAELVVELGFDATQSILLGLTADGRHRIRSALRDGDLATKRAASMLALLAQDVFALSGVVKLASQDHLTPKGVEALRRWGAEAVPHLLRLIALPGSPGNTALEIGAELGRDAAGPAIDDLRAALRAAIESNESARIRAGLRGLVWFAEASDAEQLFRVAASGSKEVRQAAADAALALVRREPSALGPLEQIGLETAPGGAVLAPLVAELRGESGFEQLQAGTAAEDPQVRRACIAALGQIGDARAAELVAFALSDENVDVRITAARVLGRLRLPDGSAPGVDALLSALTGEDAVRAAAARALGELCEPRATPLLAEMVTHPAVAVAAAALEALAAIGDDSLQQHVEAALSHPDPEVVKQAMRGAARLPADSAHRLLGVGLRHGSWHVRVLAARLLGEAGAPGRDLLHQALIEEADPMVRDAIAEALAEYPEAPG